MATNPNDPSSTNDSGTDWNDRFAFQVWLIFFMLTLCISLVNYLVGFFRG